jgi:hypothetical protein
MTSPRTKEIEILIEGAMLLARLRDRFLHLEGDVHLTWEIRQARNPVIQPAKVQKFAPSRMEAKS